MLFQDNFPWYNDIVKQINNTKGIFQMKKFLTVVIAIILMASMVTLFTGCSDNDNEQTNTNDPSNNNSNNNNTPITGTVNLGGSTSVNSVADSLRETFIGIAANSGITVNEYEGSGSGAGIRDAREDETGNFIGFSSRALTEAEAEGINAITFAIDGVALVINSSNHVANLTIEQVHDIFTGEITNWNEVGGANGEIVVVGRNAGSGTRDAIQSAVGFDDATASHDLEHTSNGEVISAVSGNVNAIGYISVHSVEGASGLKAISVNGVAPTNANIANGSFPLSRPFVLMTSTQPSPATQAFIDFVQGPGGAHVITELARLVLPTA